MSTNEKNGITVKIGAEVRQYLEEHEMTMAEFVRPALQDESENMGLSMEK